MTGITYEDDASYHYKCDSLGRTRGYTLDLPTDYEVGYIYAWGENWNATALERQLVEKGEGFPYAWNYEYDALGNITEVRLGTEEILYYGYDSLSQLVRVDDTVEGKTHTYTYDAGGNITARSILSIEQGNLLQHNLYAYCFNNPVNAMDSEGLFAITLGAVVGGALAGAAISAVSYVVGCAISGEKIDVDGMVKAVISGAICGGAGGAIGMETKFSIKAIGSAVVGIYAGITAGISNGDIQMGL